MPWAWCKYHHFTSLHFIGGWCAHRDDFFVFPVLSELGRQTAVITHVRKNFKKTARLNSTYGTILFSPKKTSRYSNVHTYVAESSPKFPTHFRLLYVIFMFNLIFSKQKKKRKKREKRSFPYFQRQARGITKYIF